MTQPSTWFETLTAVKARGEFTARELERYQETTAVEHEGHDGGIRYEWCPLCAIETQTRDMREANDLARLRGYRDAEHFLSELRSTGFAGLRDERGRTTEAD